MLAIEKISTKLRQIENGVWVSKTCSDIQFPEVGHSWCYELEQNSFWFRHRNDCLALILKRFPPAGPLFDVGGGNGFVSEGLAKAGFETILVEPAPHAVQNALRIGVRPIIQSSLEEAGFNDHSLPAVGLFDVLEHFQEDGAYLQTIKKALMRQGRLYLTVPAYDWLWSTVDDESFHKRRYNLAQLCNLLEKNGFEIEYKTYFFFFLPIPLFLYRCLPNRLGRTKKLNLETEKQTHAGLSKLLVWLAKPLLNLELGIISIGKRVPFGGSCAVVARPVG